MGNKVLGSCVSLPVKVWRREESFEAFLQRYDGIIAELIMICHLHLAYLLSIFLSSTKHTLFPLLSVAH